MALSTEENGASPPEGRIYTAARPQGAISFCVSKMMAYICRESIIKPQYEDHF